MEGHRDPDETLTSLLSLCKNTRPTDNWFWQGPMGTFHRLPHLQPGVKPALMPAGKGKHQPTKSWANLATSKFARGSFHLLRAARTPHEQPSHPPPWRTKLSSHNLSQQKATVLVNLAVASTQSWAQSWSTPGTSLIQYLITNKPFPAPGSAGNGTHKGHNVLCLP